MPRRWQPLDAPDARSARRFLAQRPIHNVFLESMLHSSAPASCGLHVCLDDRGEIHGVALLARNVVIAADDAAIDALASYGAAPQRERMIVGERTMVERYWKRISARHAPPRAVRESQPVFVLRSAALREGGAANVVVRRATLADAEEVARNSAEMILQELEYDPRAENSAFDARVRMMIERGLWWIGTYGEQTCFFVNIGARNDHTMQLQGIWTPPQLRGKGLAQAALSQICEQLLHEAPTLSLYVNSFNARAIALYERTGFERVGEFSTLLF